MNCISELFSLSSSSLTLQVFNTSYPNWSNELSSNKKKRLSKFKNCTTESKLFSTNLSGVKILLLSFYFPQLPPLHVLYFSHSQIQPIPSSMTFTPNCIGLPLLILQSIPTLCPLDYIHSLKRSSNVPSLQTLCHWYHL